MITARRRGRSDEILNFCFHGIGIPRRTLEPDEDLYWLEPEQFEEFMEVIDKYPSARITFDDGNASDVEYALPTLRKHNLIAAFFIISGRLDQPGSLTRAQVQSLVQAGMIVGSHGRNHVPWRSIDDQELHDELVSAADVIAKASGQPVRQIACPFGSYDRRVLRAIRGCGFTRVYTVDGGSANRDAWLQARYTVRAADTPVDIEHRLRFPRGSAVSAAVRRAKSLGKRWR